jgi:carbon storage regulator CsrA
MFLVLSRRKNENIVINNDITITVVEIREDKVRLGVISPKDIPVHRQEVFEAIHGKSAAVLPSPTTPEPKKGSEEPYHRFTDRARKVLQLANQEAQRFKHEYIGTEHILLGLVKEGTGVAVNVLKNLDTNPEKIRREVEQIVLAGPEMVTIGKLPQTPRAKKVIEFAIEEARNLNHNYVGTEHLLLGLLREEEGVAAQVLMNLGLRLETVRHEVLMLLDPSFNPDLLVSDEPLPLSDVDAPNLPEEVRLVVAAFDQLLDELDHFKEAAISLQDFEKAARIRDQQDKIRREKTTFIRMWSKPP